MREELIDMLCCPEGCEEELRYHDVTFADGEIVTGEIHCPSCGRYYPIREGIAQLMPSDLTEGDERTEDRVVSAKLSEMSARDDQVEAYDKMWYLSLYGLAEIPMTLSMLSVASDHTLLEGGCGTGRMTHIFAHRCRRVVSVDFSWESLRVNREKLKRKGVRNVDLLQADLCRLPIKTESVDRVVSCGVLEHIPTHATRVNALKGMSRVLRVGGNTAISAYNHSLLMRLIGEREGEHAGGIYFIRFTRKELHDLLSEAFSVEHISSSLVYYHHARCRKIKSYVPMEKEAIVI